MKKMMVVAVVAFAAVCANAGSYSWSTSVDMFYLNNGNYDEFNGYSIYTFDANASGCSYAAISAALAGGDLTALDKALGSGVVSDGYTVYEYTSEKQVSSVGTSPSEYINAYLLALSTTQADGLQYFTSLTLDPVLVEDAVKTGGAPLGASDWGVEGMPGSSGSWTAVAVPEPTSGLLLLLGVAGLALRRRRA